MIYSNIRFIDKPVSRLVQGTMMMHEDRAEEANAILDAALAAGINTFDTAHVYGNGASERAFGHWIQERGVRDQIVILDKGAHHNQDRKRVTPFDIAADVQDSLARLKVDHIDLYLLHRDDPTQPVGPIAEMLNQQHAAGHIGAFGGSNWTVERIQAANTYAAQQGLNPFVASSPAYSLAAQIQSPWPDCVAISGPDNAAARQWYLDNGISLFTWSSLAGGFFSGRFRRGGQTEYAHSYDELCAKVYAYEENFQRLDRAEELANQKGVSLTELALAFVLNQPQAIHALVGSRTAAEVEQNVRAAELVLTPEELIWLDLG